MLSDIFGFLAIVFCAVNVIMFWNFGYNSRYHYLHPEESSLKWGCLGVAILAIALILIALWPDDFHLTHSQLPLVDDFRVAWAYSGVIFALVIFIVCDAAAYYVGRNSH